MILIYSIKEDQTTNYVIDWLIKYKADYKRINHEDFYTLFTSESEENSRNNTHWFWKWNFPDFSGNKFFSSSMNNRQFNWALENEYKILYKLYFNNYVNKIVNHPDFIDIDKLTQLKFAQECGLHIPETIITSSKETLLKFNRKFNLIITKNIASSLTLYLEEKIFKTYTSEIDNDFIKTLPESFFPSLFQQYIEKEYELRIIYINERIFSCVLLDSRNKPTDIREATNNNEVEIYPYKLPVAIENRLREFMHKINLQIGSIDMIYNTEKKYVFLEVNPSGQFLGYSTACNYQVEKVIAEYLIELENEKN